MNSEEEFKQWWKENRAGEVILPGDKELWIAAKCLGHHQGLTRAAEIVEQVGIIEGVDDKYQEVEIITAILTERDKKETT